MASLPDGKVTINQMGIYVKCYIVWSNYCENDFLPMHIFFKGDNTETFSFLLIRSPVIAVS